MNAKFCATACCLKGSALDLLESRYRGLYRSDVVTVDHDTDDGLLAGVRHLVVHDLCGECEALQAFNDRVDTWHERRLQPIMLYVNYQQLYC